LTSVSPCSREKGTLYLVFEYVEHDLAGLLSATEKTSAVGWCRLTLRNPS